MVPMSPLNWDLLPIKFEVKPAMIVWLGNSWLVELLRDVLKFGKREERRLGEGKKGDRSYWF